MSVTEFVNFWSLTLVAAPVYLTTRYLYGRLETNSYLAVLFSLCAAGLIFFNNFVAIPLSWIGQGSLVVYDPVIYRVESLMECAGLVEEAHWVTVSSHSVDVVFALIYTFLAALVVLAAASEFRYANWTMWDNLFVRFTIGALIGFSLYYVLPTVGPCIFFKADFPYAMPVAASVPHAGILFADGGLNPRNAMPSMHATWTILCFLALRQSPLWHRVLGSLYVLVTFIMTIGAGLHYVLDWVVALPLVLLICGLTISIPWRGWRMASVLTGVFFLAGWCLIIRHDALPLAVSNILRLWIGLSICLPIYVQWNLVKVQKQLFQYVPESVYQRAI